VHFAGSICAAGKLQRSFALLRMTIGRNAAPFHPSLQDEHGGHAVYGSAALFDGQVGFAQEAVGLGGRQPLVPEVNRQAELLAQFFREDPHLLRLGTFGSTHAQGQADHDFLDLVLANHLSELVEVVALIAALEGFEALGGDAEGVGDGDADAAGANVEAEDAADRCGIHAGDYKRALPKRLAYFAGLSVLCGRAFNREVREELPQRAQRRLIESRVVPGAGKLDRTAGGGCPYRASLLSARAGSTIFSGLLTLFH